ncbi:MAG TPA: hypothetical protein VNK43_09465 [Gemmatimonadales bacterium]|nr:hypothetical protein [Gemmatimonadales bacterium]
METGLGARSAVDQAIERIATYFADQPTRQGLLARELLERPAPTDDQLRRWLVDRWRGELRPDGSVSGGLMPTAWRAMELMDLGAGREGAYGNPTLARVLHWVLRRQGQPGAYGEGCAPPRHREGVCEHFIGGFFSAAPPDHSVAPITIPDGKAFRAEGAARLAVSCLALRAVTRAGQLGLPAVRRHLQSLADILARVTSWEGYFSPDTVFSMLGALASGGQHPAAVDQVVELAAAHQSEDGTWPNADLFHALDALLVVEGRSARLLVARAAAALVARQRPDGTFGPTARLERAWIGLRGLVAARDSAT